MELLQIVVLALIQGITEFLPISSSAHLILVPELSAWPDQGKAFDVALHVGSLVAVVWYFRRDLAVLIRAWTRSLVYQQHSADSRLAWAVCWGTVPVGLAGLLFNHAVNTYLRSEVVIALATIIFAIVLGVADWRGRRRRDEYSLRWRDVALIGCAQALALIPGTSRSGITMSAALLLGLTREAAARFSFLLAIPVITLAGALESITLLSQPAPIEWRALMLGSGLAAISAYVCIRIFLGFIERSGMWPFVLYRLVLGGFLLWFFNLI
jgi:undecaprenyl-diphosphatase